MSKGTPKQDILILGGGPSGLSTALHLVRLAPHLAHRILVLEKARYPRPKLCAGGLVTDAEVILERLGLDVSEVPHVDARAAHFDFAGAGLRISVPGRHAIRIIRRDEFDNWLAGKARQAGIAIREGVTVRKVQPAADQVNVETDAGTFTAQVVVGADGSNGVTRRCVLPDASIHTARVLEVLTPEYNAIAGSRETTTKQSPVYNEIASGCPSTSTLPSALASPERRLSARSGRAPSNDMHEKDTAYFDFFPVPAGIAGYTWDFPTQVKGRPMRCWGIYDTNLLGNMERPALKEPLDEEMGRNGLDLNRYELKGHPIRWFSPFSPLSAPRILLVGDAAGADPIFGEGISIALGYGQVAAREIAAAFQRGEYSFSGYKRRLVRSDLGGALVTRWAITQVVYHLRWNWFQRYFWRHMGWIIGPVSWLFVVNWGKRLR